MDPVSLSLGVAGVLPLVATAIKSARSYMTAVRNARESITTLITELEALQVSLRSLNDLLGSGTLEAFDVRFDQSSVLLSCSAACETKLRSLCKKLGHESNGRMSRFLWPLSEKEHQTTIQEIRNFTQWMHFALSIDGCRLLARTSDDVVKVMGQQLDQFKSIQAIQSSTAQMFDAVQEQTQMLKDGANTETRSQILDWISTARHDHKHQALQTSRAPNTGNWILDKIEYRQWKDGSSPSNALWCHGIQGSGKTNLTSIIVDDILESASGPICPLAFIYFDYQEQELQTPSQVWPLVLRQLVEMMPEIPKPVGELYERISPISSSLPLHECGRLILDVVQNLECAYLVIDALDECDGSSSRRPILQFLEQLIQSSKVRVLVTSRPHIQDVHYALCNSPQIEIKAQRDDLKTYLREELLHGGIYDIADEDFANKIINTLADRADGMFLLPVLQVRTILKEPTIGDMEDRLEELSRDLTQAFGETVARIQRQAGNRGRIGMGVLMYLTHWKRPLDIAELSDALAIRPNQTRVNPKYRPSPNVVVECCQGLVAIDPETAFVRPAHHAIQEYLVCHSRQLFPRAEADIASNCLQYLLFEDFKDGPWETQDEISLQIRSSPFLLYATQHYGRHVKPVESDPEVWTLLSRLFASPAAIAAATQVNHYGKGYREEYVNPDECRSRNPLHLAARCGLNRALAALLESGRYGVNDATKMGTTAIIQAAASGHVSTVRILLQQGADPYLSNWYGNALHCAVEGGYANTIRELVSWGMDPNPSQRHWRAPIRCVIDRDSAEACEALVELGATLNPDDHLHLLHHAALEGCERIVGLIIRRGWADPELRSSQASEASRGRTPLHYAAMASDPGALEVLVEAGADVNARDERGRTPLDYAEEYERQGAVRLLLAAGAVAGQEQPPAPWKELLVHTGYEPGW